MFKTALSKVSSGVKRIPSGVKNIDLGHKSGILHETAQTVVAIAAGEGFGYVHGLYREKAALNIMGKEIPANLLVGAGAKLLAILGTAVAGPGGKVGKVAPYLNTVADVGIATYFFADGVSRGTKESGRKLYILEKGATAPALPAGMAQTDVVGATVGGGAYLNKDQLKHLSSMK